MTPDPYPVRRFFVPTGTVRARNVTLGPHMAHRLGRVLRLKRGDRIVLAEGRPREYEVQLTGVSANSVTGVVVGELEAPPEPAVELALYQSLIRVNRFDLVLEKGTEIGVCRFVPVISARSQVRPDEPVLSEADGAKGEPGRAERWRRIVTEAAEQCGRGRVPAVDAPLPLAQALASSPGLRIVPWEGGAVGAVREPPLPGLGAYLRGLSSPPRTVSLFIGPEGGFEPEEVELARRHGAALVSLGPRILRSETAGIVAAALVLHELGEMD
ncbi:MAG: 16S rRNA (uracil(1498)-N(3))-methyltransferase [Chloroflexi bacterium]|nr:16S rRNA (uracil(1498)-N(3))-methyltransferase [Chloroflexota bacterium]